MSIAGPRGESSKLSLDQLVSDKEKENASEIDYTYLREKIDENWSEVVDSYNRECEGGRKGDRSSWGVALKMAADLKLLFPEKADDLELNEEKWGEMKKLFDLDQITQGEKSYEELTSVARNLSIVFPDRVESLDFASQEQDFLEVFFDNYVEMDDWRGVLNMAAGFQVMFPGRVEALNMPAVEREVRESIVQGELESHLVSYISCLKLKK